jgi:hypothetical protein
MRPTLPKLTKGADGKYHGAYRGEEFRVWREDQPDHYRTRARAIWIARGRELEARSQGSSPTRDDAVRQFCEAVDMAAVSIPEIDQLLARWAADIKAIVPQLRERDAQAMIKLHNLRSVMRWMDNSARSHAVEFETGLAELKARIEEEQATPRLQSDANARLK